MVQIASTIIEGDHHNLTAGTSFSLICMIDNITEIRPEFTFEWMHSNVIDSMSVINQTNSSELHFSSLKLSDAGEYMCQVNIISSFLSSDLTLMSILSYPVRVIGKFYASVCKFLVTLPNQHSTSSCCDCNSIISTYFCWIISQCHLCC